jgi:hypothetical protein
VYFDEQFAASDQRFRDVGVDERGVELCEPDGVHGGMFFRLTVHSCPSCSRFSKGSSMKSRFLPGLVVVLACSFVAVIGCKENQQPAAAKVATSATAPAVTKATGTSTSASTSTSAIGEAHDDLSSMGIPLYPNVVESGWTDTEAIRLLVGKPKLDTPRMRNGEMSTKDSFDVVYAWYRKQMPSGSEPAAAAASNHTTDDGDRMALFEAGTNGDPTYQRVMILRGKNDEYTLVNLSGLVAK